MPLRSYETQSGVTWFECRTCKHMWHQQKLAPLPTRLRQPLRH